VLAPISGPWAKHLFECLQAKQKYEADWFRLSLAIADRGIEWKQLKE
jgi:hypothetical protein